LTLRGQLRIAHPAVQFRNCSGFVPFAELTAASVLGLHYLPADGYSTQDGLALLKTGGIPKLGTTFEAEG
jgi:hypothetical protein